MYSTTEMVTAIDQEISRLQTARNLLAGTGTGKRRGRKPGSGNTLKMPPTSVNYTTNHPTPPGRKRRTMSALTRKKIADAQKRRWGKTTSARKPAKGKKATGHKSNPSNELAMQAAS